MAAAGVAIVSATPVGAAAVDVASGEPPPIEEPEPSDAPSARVGPVDVLQVSGLIDPIVIDSIEDAIDQSASDGAQALILQTNSRGAVVSDDEMESLLERVAAAPIPVAIWVGPSGARLYGAPAQLLAVADVTGMAPGARVGHGELRTDGDHKWRED